ncbi:NlpC/P60 family protein [Arthrobacter sp. LAPM80]|uniref:C40 family peptidase n=1 Tax=Arthrobacter sp. LAPM80 TaxID=3141788 RepID=UPI00398ABDAD
MAISQGKSRHFQLSMAVVCTLLASGGFVGAGYVGNASADAAAGLPSRTALRTASSVEEAEPIGFHAFADQGLGMKVSFANTLILAKKPAANKVFDLTDPNGNTPHLGGTVNSMRGDIPEISAELISQVRKDILTAAYQGLGHSYVWGGTSFENGWDCSGFVQWTYGQAGVGLPRTEQWLPMVETNNPQPGDIVVQNPDGPNHWSHIGIYIGGGKMISALNPSVGTILHTPAATSSSSTYFTMPAFAAADDRAKSDAAKKTQEEKDATKSTESTKAATSPPARPSTSQKPGTTPPGTTPPGTKPGTTGPGTPPPATTPSLTPHAPLPETPPATSPATTQPVTTSPETPQPAATTNPGTTQSAASTDPGTTQPAATTGLPSSSMAATFSSPPGETQVPGSGVPTP